jgi:hypothetical protein
MAKLIDNSGDWIAGDTIFIQTGDVVDRGPDTIILFRYMAELTAQATKAGGMLISLLGIH